MIYYTCLSAYTYKQELLQHWVQEMRFFAMLFTSTFKYCHLESKTWPLVI